MFIPLFTFSKTPVVINPPDPEGDSYESIAFNNQIISFDNLAVGNQILNGAIVFNNLSIAFDNLAITNDSP